MSRKLPGANGPAARRSNICRSRLAGKGRIWRREGGLSLQPEVLQPERRSRFWPQPWLLPRHDCCEPATLGEHSGQERPGYCLRRYLATPLRDIIGVGKNCRFVREADRKFRFP